MTADQHFIHEAAEGGMAEVAQMELVGSEYSPKSAEERKTEKEGAAAAKTRSVGDRLRSAARGLRSGTKGEQGGGAKGQAGGQTRGKAQKSTTPRKAGGS